MNLRDASAKRDTFVNAVEAIYAAAANPGLWPATLQAIADATGDVGCVLVYHRDDGTFGSIVSPDLQAAQADYEREWSRHDIRGIRGVQRGYELTVDGTTDRDIVSDEEIATHPFYRDFLIPHGLGWFAAAGVSPDPHVAVWVSVQRNYRKPPFSDAEVALVVRLARHVEQALRIGLRIIEAEAANLALQDVFERLGMGVAVLDASGRVVFSNASARTLLGSQLARSASAPGFGIDEPNALRDGIERLLNASAAELADAARPPVVLLPAAEGRVAVYLLPLFGPERTAAHALFAQGRLALLAIQMRQERPADPALVRDLLGVTLGEARVAALVAAGSGPREAAEQLGISEETSRTVLKRVFAKTGVSRQSELAALLARLVLR